MSASLCINCFPQRKDLVWEVPGVWSGISQCRTAADKQAVLWGQIFPDSNFFRFSGKSSCWLVFGLIFIMEKPLTHVRVQIPRWFSKRFVLGRLKRLEAQSSFPEETVRGFLDLLKYVWLIFWLWTALCKNYHMAIFQSLAVFAVLPQWHKHVQNLVVQSQ